jgi:phospho-N-acetylmuramoyl-pentapeptide-transferase
MESDLILNVIKVALLSAASFVTAVLITPILTHYLYAYKMWRREARTIAPDGAPTPIFNKLHKENETSKPRLGGLLIWGVTLLVAYLFWGLAKIFDFPLLEKLNFVSRNQTWILLATLFAGSLLGLADDLMQILGFGKYKAGGIRFTRRVFLVLCIALASAYWFYVKLGVQSIYIPGAGDVFVGLWFIPIFILTMLAVFSGGVIDGLDGLAGGAFAIMFAAFGGIAFFQNQVDIAAFTGVLLGALLGFLWFNIPPARFYMGETGMIGLTTALTVLAFLTNSAIVLPIVGVLLVIESLSVIIQLLSKRWRGKKVFLVAPIHHHFEAIGWPAYKVVMRAWVIGIIFAIIGMVIALIGR